MIRKLCFVALLYLLTAKLFGGDVYSWDFDNCEIKEILYMVSMDTGVSISADDTVLGKGSFRFCGENFSDAFDSFLTENRLWVQKNEKRWIVSRFNFEQKDALYSLDACDLLPVQILEKLSLNLEEVLNYEQLPSLRLSMHFRNVTKEELIDGIAARLGNYETIITDRQITFFKNTTKKNVQSEDMVLRIIRNDSGSYNVEIKNCLFTDALENLFFQEENKHFSLLGNPDSKIYRSSFVADNFTDALSELCFQNNFSFIESDSTLYIFPSENTREVLLNGNKIWKKYELKYTSAEKAISSLNKRFGKIDVIETDNRNSFICGTNEKLHKEIAEFITEYDVFERSYVVELLHIKNDTFIKNVPPEFDRSKFHISDENGKVYFSGSEKDYEELCKRIREFDNPPVCIQYDLLILQYDETVQNNWASNFGINKLSLGDRNNIGAQIGSLINLNLNLVTSFGLTLASSIQSSIEENSTKVYADTILHGTSGKNISFQNTSTYRYRDNNLDPETGKPVYSGVTREITSGIKLDVCGWVSGDGMITSVVTASVSRQGIDTSSSTGNPPPTTEKIVTTEVCGKSGEPIVLSGLIQNSTTEETQRTPVVSKIPFAGKLFRKELKTKEKSQMVIFLVPHVKDYEFKENRFLTDEWAEKRICSLRNLEVHYE